MTLVVPLGKSAFEFFDEDRDVIHTSAIAIKQALDLSFSIRLQPIASDFLLEGLTACRAIAGFDSLKHLGLGERPGLWDFTQQVEMIGHQHIGQNANAAKSLQAAHELDESLRLARTMAGDLENKAALDHPGNAVVKPLTVGFDPWETHELRGNITQQIETL